ncbi:archaetidylserine decarboxylase [Mangrovitalea sediminis]|uniref:archaetidylserine decarboxylase n=1 Tax=Mangrovitalea sediminis TaxID=1982043 RepID=UPI000BE54221|nr:archaetidylserine decarboxylase [Mangrovitalea sediminis]
MLDKLFVWSQYITPHHALSRAAGLLAESRANRVKQPFIHWFAKHYGVDMSEAENADLDAYPDFNSFFTRALRPGARPIASEPDTLICPVDGAISQLGDVTDDRVFQAKGQSFSLTELLGGDAQRAAPFQGGHFATLYLSPKDYHRIHMPITGTLKEMVHVPGRLFSVNPVTAANVPRLFARNERVVALFDTEWGPMALVLVGAMIVASVETVWSGLVAHRHNGITAVKYSGQQAITLEKGAEMGRFRLGSTVVMVMPRGSVKWDGAMTAGTSVRMGQAFGSR